MQGGRERAEPTTSAAPSPPGSTRLSLQRALHRLHPVALDNVADLHILVMLEGHAAFLSGHYLARIVLEALELGKLSLVHDDAVADETHIGSPLDHSVGNAAARNIPDLGDLENFQNGRIAKHSFAHARRQ